MSLRNLERLLAVVFVLSVLHAVGVILMLLALLLR
jgi:hypothetical protein